MNLNRRRFVGGAAAAAGLGLVAPGHLGRVARATTPAPSTASTAGLDPADCPIDHVVVLTMENRSFDHFFGGLRLLGRSGDVDGLTGEEHNTWSNGDREPVFHLGGNTCTRLDPPHEWSSVRMQFADGDESGYLRAVEHHYGIDPDDRPPDARDVMGYYTGADIPFSWGVADAYTICDAYRSPVAGPTLPNRHYLHAATSGGIWDNYLDSRSRDASPSPQGDPTHGFDFRTIYEEMSDTADHPAVDWRVYFTEAPFTMLYRWPRSTHPERFLPFSQFLVDAARGDLPAYTTIDPGYFTASDHAPQNVQLGQLFIASVYAALATSPLWPRTALIVTYDEDGGFYDHAPHEFVPDERGSRVADGAAVVDRSATWQPDPDEPTAPYNAGEHADDPLYGDFSLTGGRLPTMVLGPWAKEGHVSHVPADHTSVLALAGWRFGLPPLTMRDQWRRDAGHDLLDCFDFDRAAPRAPVALPVPSFHASMFTDCGSTYLAPPAPYIEGPRDPDNPALDLDSVLAAAVAAGAVPRLAPAGVLRTYERAFALAAELPDLI